MLHRAIIRYLIGVNAVSMLFGKNLAHREQKYVADNGNGNSVVPKIWKQLHSWQGRHWHAGK